jgi:pyruvate formate lyase activating enzyme
MEEARYWEIEKGKVHCKLCRRGCFIPEGKSGFCSVRKNVENKLYSMVYGRPAAINIDPIEKKPFYHFNPGSAALSLGTLGCNFRCKFCCNWELSQAKVDEAFKYVKPEEIVETAVSSGCQGIAYTYVEPTIFFEYAYDIAKLAKEKGLYNVFVTNGYAMEKPLKDITPYLDAVVIDFKGNNENFYREYASAELDEVKQGALLYLKTKAHIEITNLVVPEKTDDPDEIRELAKWISKHFGSDTPMHLIRYFPTLGFNKLPPTDIKTLEKLYAVAKKELDYVYIGNVAETVYNDTYCPKCETLLIDRLGFNIEKYNIKDGKCPKCGTSINIVGQFY